MIFCLSEPIAAVTFFIPTNELSIKRVIGTYCDISYLLQDFERIITQRINQFNCDGSEQTT